MMRHGPLSYTSSQRAIGLREFKSGPRQQSLAGEPPPWGVPVAGRPHGDERGFM